MRRRSVIHALAGGGAVAGASAMLGGCSLLFGPESVTFRYRMTVEVQTPQGLRSGSAVREVQVTNSGFMAHARFKVRGEAVAVDLPNGQTLFALLTGYGYSDSLAVETLYPQAELEGENVVKDAKKAIANRAVVEVSREPGPGYVGGWPTLVRFRDISDPKTIEMVDPYNSAASFGAGYAIRRITIQITDDPVTTEINRRLPWFPRMNDMLGKHFRADDIPGIGDLQSVFLEDR